MLTLKLLRLNFYKFLALCLGFFLFPDTPVNAQDWVEYISMKDKGVMSIAIDLSVDMSKPNYKNLLIVGTRFKSCLKNGFPKDQGLDELFNFSDSTSAVINKSTRNRLVGIITYQCMGFDIYYIKDTLEVRTNLNKVIDDHFKVSETYVNIKRDKTWEYYYSYLYPPNFSLEFIYNQDYLRDLVLQGDDLKGLRKVNHWMYFKNVNKRNKAGDQLKKLKFSLDSIGYKKERKLPYELKISRKDSIDPESILQLTTMLRLLGGSFDAKYDGWGTELKIKD